MNESLVSLNRIFYNVNTFERYLKLSGTDDLQFIAIKEEIRLHLKKISSEINYLNIELANEINGRLELLISKVDDLFKNYLNERDYYFERFYEGPDWGYMAGIEDEQKSSDYYHKAVASFENERDFKIQRSMSIIEILQNVKTALRDLIDEINVNEIRIAELDIGQLKWTSKNDTELLELVTALFVSGSINNVTNNLTRKDAIIIFSHFFGINIKDSESKLTSATQRKKEIAPFLNKLKVTFEEYAKEKEKKLDSQRK